MKMKTHLKALLKKNDIDIVFILLLCVVCTFTLEKVIPKFIFSLFILQTALVIAKYKSVTFSVTKYFWLLIAVYGLNVVGMLYTENASRGFNVMTQQVSFVLFPLFYSVYKVKNIGLLLKAYVISIFIFIAIFEIDTLYRFFYKSDVFPLNLDLFFSYRYTGAEVTKIFETHNAYFGMYIMFSNVIIINFLQKIKKNHSIILLLLLITFQSLFLLQLVAKTAILLNTLIVCVSLGYFFIKNKKQKALIFTLILFCFITILSVKQLRLPLSRIADRFVELKEGTGATRETRIKIWKAALPIIEENMFIGIGTGDVQSALHAEFKKQGILSKSNVHNQYLDYFMRFGIIGLVLFITVFGYSLFHAISTRNYMYFCFTIIIMVCCMTENILSRQLGIVFFAGFNYLLYLNAKNNKCL